MLIAWILEGSSSVAAQLHMHPNIPHYCSFILHSFHFISVPFGLSAFPFLPSLLLCFSQVLSVSICPLLLSCLLLFYLQFFNHLSSPLCSPPSSYLFCSPCAWCALTHLFVSLIFISYSLFSYFILCHSSLPSSTFHALFFDLSPSSSVIFQSVILFSSYLLLLSPPLNIFLYFLA